MIKIITWHVDAFQNDSWGEQQLIRRSTVTVILAISQNEAAHCVQSSFWFPELWPDRAAHTHCTPLSEVWRGRRQGGSVGAGGGQAGCSHGRQLLTSKVLLQRGKEVTDDRHTPRLPQQLLPLLTVHVPHVGVMFGETKDSGRKKRTTEQFLLSKDCHCFENSFLKIWKSLKIWSFFKDLKQHMWPVALTEEHLILKQAEGPKLECCLRPVTKVHV